MINFKCEKCDHYYSISDKYAEQRILCRWCGRVNLAPPVRPPLEKYVDKTMPDFDGLFTALLEHERSAPALEPAVR
ncbi:MAG: hypothetical protein FJ263_10225 [Planctomycetes bacterium]|nr:hypothetical protein [Planctomycetota bacterium]